MKPDDFKNVHAVYVADNIEEQVKHLLLDQICIKMYRIPANSYIGISFASGEEVIHGLTHDIGPIPLAKAHIEKRMAVSEWADSVDRACMYLQALRSKALKLKGVSSE